MWNNLLKLTLVSWVWQRYRRTIIALPLLLLYFWLVNLIHGDVIAYAQLNNDTAWLGWTFVIKWLFILLGIAGFVLLHIIGKPPPAAAPTLKQKMQPPPEPPPASAEDHDRFDAIRRKQKLRSRAEVILETKQRP